MSALGAIAESIFGGGRLMVSWRMIGGRWTSGACAFAIGAVLLGAALSCEPKLAVDAANGSYVNDCCGSVVLRDGRMVLGETKAVGYQLGHDDAGPYLLPETFVGTWEERGFEVDGTRAPVKVRLDALPRPTRIEIPAPSGRHSFEREMPRPLRLPS